MSLFSSARRIRFSTIGLGLTFASLFVAGCNSSAPAPESTPGAKTADNKPAPSADAIKVGMVFDSGGRGDKSFNDSAYAGLQKAEKELGIEVKTIDSRQEKDYESNIAAMAEGGCGIVFAVGLAQAKALETIAPKFPDTKFAIIDADVTAPNVRSLKFNEEQGSFLAGYLAGLVSKKGSIGFVGGQSIPLIQKFEAGYAAGAISANPKITVLPAKYTESWDDVSLGKSAAKTLYDQGADIVFSAAGRCGLGVIDAARETGQFAIGVDSDQDAEAKGTILTSMVKHVDNAVYSTIADVKAGKFSSGTKIYTLADGGVGLTEFAYTKDKIGAENIKKIADVAKLVASGEIKVPTTREELKAFKPK